MENDKKVGMGLIYGLTALGLVFGGPLILAAMVWKDFLGAAESLSRFPGVSESGGVVSGAAAGFYGLAVYGLLGAGLVAALGGGTLGVAASSTGDGGTTTPQGPTETPGSAPTATSAPTPTPTSTPEPTATPNVTLTLEPEPTEAPDPNKTDTPQATPEETEEHPYAYRREWSQERRYEFFMGNFADDLEGGEGERIANVTEYSVSPDSNSANLTFIIEEPGSPGYVVDTRTSVLGAYSDYAIGYIEDPVSNETWVPDTLYLRLETPEGELFETGYVRQEWALAYENNYTEAVVYVSQYNNVSENGPGHPNYNG